MNKLFFLAFLLIGSVFINSTARAIEVSYDFPCPPQEAGLGDCAAITSSTISIPQYIVRFYQFGVGIAGILAVGMIVVGAIYRTISGGSQDKIREGNDMIKNAIWGIVLLLGSYIILHTINPRLTILAPPYLEQLSPPATFQFTPAQGESELPPPSDNPDVIEFCRQTAPSRPDCLRGVCHIINGIQIGCENFVEFNTPLMKANQCRWGNESSKCYVNSKTLTAFENLQNTPLPLQNIVWQVTEAYPPTGSHSQNGGHYNGCSIDIALRESEVSRNFCPKLEKLIQAARNAGFGVNVEYANCKAYGIEGGPSELSTGGHLHLKTNNCP